MAAQQRQVDTLPDEPLIAGFDASGGGSAWNVIRFRRGLDACNVPPPIRIPGEQSRDRNMLLAKLAEIMKDERPSHKVARMFVDSAFGAPYVEHLHLLGYSNRSRGQLRAPAPDHHQANMRAYMWNLTKEWLLHGAIPANDEKLALDLEAPGYHLKANTNQLVIESKEHMMKRGQASPDDGDAMVLTFAAPVAPPVQEDPDEDEEFGHSVFRLLEPAGMDDAGMRGPGNTQKGISRCLRILVRIRLRKFQRIHRASQTLSSPQEVFVSPSAKRRHPNLFRIDRRRRAKALGCRPAESAVGSP